MSKTKKIVIAAISLLLVAALAFGAIYLLPKLNQKEVEVYPVSRIREFAWGDQLGSYGNVMAGNIQNVIPNNEMLISEIAVSAGDRVSVGDTLLTYDTTIENLNIKTIRINIDILNNKIAKAGRELDAAKALVASSPPPPPPSPERPIRDEDELTAATADFFKISGDGTAKNKRMIFHVDYGTAINADYLASLYHDPQNGDPIEIKYVEFRVFYGNDVLMFRWTVDGETFNGFDPATLPNGWNLSSGIEVNDDQSISASVNQKYGKFEQLASTVDYIGGPHYSQAEIDKMINDKELELANYRTELKQKNLDLETANAGLGDGTIKSQIDGVVAEVNNPDEIEAGKPLIVVQSGKGYRVEGNIGELNLDKISIGQMVTVSSWQTGSTYTAEITEIYDFPARYPSGTMGMENPLTSYYVFVAMIETDEVLTVGDWVEISISGGDSMQPNPDVLYLPNAFIREENGSSYVMKTDEEGKLIKQFVVTGKSNYGYATEIKSGITEEDHIAFPYGKLAKEGAPTVIAEGGIYG